MFILLEWFVGWEVIGHIAVACFVGCCFHWNTSVGKPEKTNIHQLCANTGCRQEDWSKVMANKNVLLQMSLMSFSLHHPAVCCISFSSYKNGLWDGRWMAVKLLFLGCCFRDLLKITCCILVSFSSNFSSMHFIRLYVVRQCSSSDIATGWKNS